MRLWNTGLQGAQDGRVERQKDSSGLRAEGEAKRPGTTRQGHQVVGKEGRNGKACPSLLEAFGVHRATHSPPQLKMLCSLPGLAVVFANKSGFVIG